MIMQAYQQKVTALYADLRSRYALFMANTQLGGGQKLAVHYFAVAMVLFMAQLLFGLLAGLQFIWPGFLYEILDFNVNRMVHINAMVVWMLYGFIGSVYWFLEDESGVPVVGLKWGQLAFWVLTGAVLIVVLVYLLVQIGSGNDTSLWFINEGREYIEAPRWADIGIVAVMLVFFYNVAATFAKGKWSGIAGVLTLDLVALAGLYTAGMFYVTNISVDQYWWWWVIHLWVEATWEVLVGCIMAWSLMKLLGVRRQVVQTWLYIEVALMFGSGILVWVIIISGSARRNTGLRSAAFSLHWNPFLWLLWWCIPSTTPACTISKAAIIRHWPGSSRTPLATFSALVSGDLCILCRK